MVLFAKRHFMNRKLLTNIKALLQIRPERTAAISGLKMDELPSLENAWLLIEDGKIASFGAVGENMPKRDENTEWVDCKGGFVLPSFVDSHTHLVFAKSREEEFEMRIKGYGYEEIAAAGGGILNSAAKLASMSEDELFDSALERLHEVMATGTGAIEIKSGYGLTTEAELKMLHVARRLKEASLIPVKATFLGAHAFPKEYKTNHQGYIDLLINEMMPRIAGDGLADYVDVFCERGYYSAKETEMILEAGARHGLKPKIHVNQFSLSGGVQVGVKMGAVSVDHLEVIGQEEIDCLKGSNTIPTLLPSCSFFLGIPYGPARDLMAADIPVALATDYNPGSTPSGNIPFVMSLACIKQKMTPNEVINACTMNSAAAMELQDEMGSITVGKRANLIVTKPMPSLAYWMYSFGKGTGLIEDVIVS